ncbi:MAG: cytochrome ubiquinol oxidase subunit I [Pseudomonadales bacterium]|jgi:cytochrome d ubiquinol oxidase subunit I|nr:cytochrome ubiquinol oxidase subunit I [Pseudomonadales bacterium]
MSELDPLLLARLQFAANISFHILFPTISIGLCWVLLYFRTRFTLTGDQDWEHAYTFWVKVFALTFAIGVVTGVTMSFQFGTNWPGFLTTAGNITGPLLGYEVLTSFFLEATFLGVMLFGKHLISNRMHLIASALVALGTTISAFWILSLDSWMQTPAGHVIRDGIYYADSWWAVIFNPSFPYRFSHMVVASLLTCAFVLMGISSWRFLNRVDGPATWKVFKTGAALALVLAPLQIFIGDLHGINTLEYQPAKVAAMEGLWKTENGAPFTLFALPDESTRSNRFAIEIPYAASLILTHSASGTVRGLDEFAEHPPVSSVFWSFRVMVGVGLLMLIVALWVGWTVFLRKKPPSELLLRCTAWMTWSGWVAVIAGWWVTEIGRQPWLIYDEYLTAQAVADHPAGTVLTTLLAWLVLYGFILFFYIRTLKYIASKPAASLQNSAQHYPGILSKRN